ncbi:MAG: phage integrase SAM-like domain-containing protein [Siphonobacter aquaeclarae]|nr:phage integrase SAM-like domain-containing protein [Siphonobacter aquaeclarae]
MDGHLENLGSTGIRIQKGDWNTKSGMINPTDPLSTFKNEKLFLVKARISAIYNDLFRAGKPFTVQTIKKAYITNGAGFSLLSTFDAWLKHIKNDDETILEESSLEVYDNVRKKLTNFLIDEKDVRIPIEQFDIEMLKKFRAWMRRKHHHEDSYIRKNSQVVKQVTCWALTQKMTDFDPLAGFRVKNERKKMPIHLTPKMYDDLRSHRFRNPFLQEVADVFLVYCRTGFHYRDFRDMARNARQAIQPGVDEKNWIYHPRIKTGVMTKVPVFDEVLPIIEKYGGWENLPVKANKTMNDWLKLMAAEMGWPDPLASVISTKTGRKTFSDWCLNTLGISREALAVMLGRLTTRGLEDYGRPDERRVALELGRVKEKEYTLVN